MDLGKAVRLVTLHSTTASESVGGGVRAAEGVRKGVREGCCSDDDYIIYFLAKNKTKAKPADRSHFTVSPSRPWV